MFKNYRFEWVDAFLFLLFSLCAAIIIFITLFVTSTKFTHQYSLGVDGKQLTITKEIDWCEDDNILLDRSVTYWEAIRMVDSLNKTLK